MFLAIVGGHRIINRGLALNFLQSTWLASSVLVLGISLRAISLTLVVGIFLIFGMLALSFPVGIVVCVSFTLLARANTPVAHSGD